MNASHLPVASRFGWLIGGLGAALLLTLVPFADVYAKDTITWGWVDKGPGSIPTGPDKNLGIEDRIRTLLKERLTGYDHEEVQATVPRIVNEMKAGNHWCSTGFIKTAERENTFARFSVPAAFWPAPHILIQKNRRSEFEALGELSLEQLLANRALRTAVVRGAAYNPSIASLLLQNPPSEVVSDYVDGVKMLLSGRLDYLVEVASRANYYLKSQGKEADLIGLPFKEMSKFTVTYVMCPKNEWGAKVISAIDAVLLAERPTPRYRRIIELWSDEDSVRQIRKAYDSVLLRSD